MDYIALENKIKGLFTNEDIYYVKMMSIFEQLSKDYLYLMNDYLDVIDLDENFSNQTPYLVSLRHSCKFIKNININYYRIFKKFYKSGNLILDLENNDAFSEIDDNGRSIVNWPINFNIDDSFCLIHEFNHYLNIKPCVSIAREYLTETFAILFEFLLNDYYHLKNYSNKEVSKVKLLRFAYCYDDAYSLYNMTDMIDIYLKYGALNHNTVSNYFNNNAILLKNFNDENLNYVDDSLPFFDNKKYLLGIVLACDIHQRILMEPKYLEKIFYLIENINDMKLEECLKNLNVNFNCENGSFKMEQNDYQRIFNNVKKELEQTYKEYKEDINEESYCNSGTNMRR